jgi:hypothetical protein
MRRLRPIILGLLFVALVACTGTTSSGQEPTSSGQPTSVASTTVDPLVPYSPPATPHADRTSGFIPDTLTLTATAGATITLTPVTTSMTLTFVQEARAFVVYLDVRDRTDTAWTGVVGAEAQVTDTNGGVFPAEAARKGDLHPNPGQYGGSNRNLLKSVKVEPGKTVSGALVFHVTGGNRPITLRISLDGGTTWAEWATNLGTF